MSISYDDNHYITGTSILLHMYIYSTWANKWLIINRIIISLQYDLTVSNKNDLRLA